MKMKRKIRIKWKSIIILILFMFFLSGLIISIINVANWKLDSNDINKQVDEIQNVVKVVDKEDTEKTEIVEQEEIEEVNPYWDYIKMKMIDVDFNELKKLNNHTKGWIQVNGTNINYPFVQAPDNKYYLTHSFDKSYNSAGWVFLDYRNNLLENDKNTIIYAHGRIDKTMFGSLKNFLTNGWLKDKENYVVKLSTEHENTLWQVFSVYHIPTTSDYIQVDFVDNKEFKKLTDLLINRSTHNFNTTISENDRILTLSTCYNETDKVVLHAKLIKRELR